MHTRHNRNTPEPCSVLASAAVAAVTTLLIEYLARPWLDARKDRVVEDHRQRRTAINGVKRSLTLIGELQVLGTSKEEIDILTQRAKQIAAEIEKLMDVCGESIDIGIPRPTINEWTRATVAISMFAAIFQSEEMPSEEAWGKFSSDSDRLIILCRAVDNAQIAYTAKA